MATTEQKRNIKRAAYICLIGDKTGSKLKISRAQAITAINSSERPVNISVNQDFGMEIKI